MNDTGFESVGGCLITKIRQIDEGKLFSIFWIEKETVTSIYMLSTCSRITAISMLVCEVRGHRWMEYPTTMTNKGYGRIRVSCQEGFIMLFLCPR